jgi:hypothetical protein
VPGHPRRIGQEPARRGKWSIAMADLSLPPSVTVSPTIVGVSVLTDDGITVQVSLPRPRGLHDLPADEVAGRARRRAGRPAPSAAESLETQA